MIQRTLVPIRTRIFNDTNKRANQIHGSLILGDYFYFSCRSLSRDSGTPNAAAIVRIPIKDWSNYDIIYPVDQSSPTTGLSQFNDMKYDGKYIWIVSSNTVVIRIDPDDFYNYRTYKAWSGQETLEVDDNYLYTFYNTTLYKSLKSSLSSGSFPTGGNVLYRNLNSIVVTGSITRQPHSMFLDKNTGYLWLNCSTMGTTPPEYPVPIIGVRTSDLQGEFVQYIGKSTDDVCYKKEQGYLIFGVESTDTAAPWYNYSTYALKVNPLPPVSSSIPTYILPKLGSTDAPNPSYGVYCFNNYIINIKTNNKMYVYDRNFDISMWSTGSDPINDGIISAIYTISDTNIESDSKIINEVLLLPNNHLVLTLWSNFTSKSAAIIEIDVGNDFDFIERNKFNDINRYYKINDILYDKFIGVL